MDISHEEFITIFKEKDRYERMKYNLINENKKQEIIKLSSVNQKNECYKKNIFIFFWYI